MQTLTLPGNPWFNNPLSAATPNQENSDRKHRGIFLIKKRIVHIQLLHECCYL